MQFKVQVVIDNEAGEIVTEDIFTLTKSADEAICSDFHWPIRNVY